MSRDFWPFLGLKRFDLDPKWIGKNGFTNFFVFAKIFDHKVRKSGVSIVNYYVDTQIFLQIRLFSNFLIIAIGYVNTPKYRFLTDCSFKICEKPLKFSKSVQLVIDVSAQFSKISNYIFCYFFLLVFYFFQSIIISRVSAYSLTTLTQCPLSCWLRGHTFFANVFTKMKKSEKPFLPVHMGPRSDLSSKQKWSKISWHCPFKSLLKLFLSWELLYGPS